MEKADILKLMDQLFTETFKTASLKEKENISTLMDQFVKEILKMENLMEKHILKLMGQNIENTIIIVSIYARKLNNILFKF